jgi:nucleoside-diphosphate-sugar epimerase
MKERTCSRPLNCCVFISRLHALGWRASTSLRSGLAKTYADFLDNHAGALSR